MRSFESKTRPDLSRVFSGVLSLGLVLGLGQAVADETAFSVRGFGTLGMARTNTQEVEFVRDLSQPRGITNSWRSRTDTVFGVQANYQFTPQLEGVVQAVSRYRYDKSYTPDISWAFLKYEPNSTLSLRAGRLGTEFFMLSDSRLIGYSYLTVRPPGDFFWHLPFYSIEGADAALSLPLGEAVVRGKVFSGISHEKVSLAEEMWNLSGSRMSGAYVDYLAGPLTLRASYSSIRFSQNMPIDKVLLSQGIPALQASQTHDYLAAAGTHADYYSLGMVYERGPWQLQLMFNQIVQGSRAFENSKSAYALVGYRFGEVTPYVGYSQVASARRSDTLDPVTARTMMDSHVHQRAVLLGARWDVARNTALKVQLDLIDGTADSIFPYRREKAAFSGNVNVLGATLDFVF